MTLALRANARLSISFVRVCVESKLNENVKF